MLRVRNLSIVASVALLVVVVGTVAQAAPTFEKSAIYGRGNVGRAVRPLAAPQSLTQSTDPNTLEEVMVACSGGGITTDNHWMRLFDLDGDHGISGEFCVTSVDYGVEISTANPDTSVNVYCRGNGVNTPGQINFSDLTQQDGVTINLQDGNLFFINQPVGGCCTGADDDLVVEVAAADCLAAEDSCLQFWIGGNDNGQSAPSYIGAADCGINNPVDLALIGFPDNHLAWVVNGDDDGGGGGVPAVGPIGAIVMVLVLLGTSAILLRRQVIG